MIYVLFVIGFVLLVKWADLLVDWSSAVAKKFRISNIVIWLTIVAFWTSAPELVVNVLASVNNNTDIAIWNILWSNIANIFLILGIASIIYPIKAQKNTVLKEIPFSLLAALMVWILANDMIIDWATSSAITRIDGLVLIWFFIIFLYYMFGITKSSSDLVETEIHTMPIRKSTLFIVLWLTGLIIGGKWIVDGAVKIAELFNVSQSLIWLTIVAIWTSLPELATSAVAAMKKQSDIAIWNVIWSNIFNIFWILWISSIISPLPFNTSSNSDILMTIFASLILFIIMFVGKKHVVERRAWVMMILMYVGYVVYLVVQQ